MVTDYLATVAEILPGLSKRQILWELYFPVGLQLMHWHRRKAGCWTIPPRPPMPAVPDEEIDTLLR